MLKMTLPTKILLYVRKKDNKEVWFRLNLNQYRNTHHSMLNKSKKIFHAIISKRILADKITEKFNKYNISYQLIVSNNRKLDSNNIYTIVDKYFQDALVVNGIFENDNYEHCMTTTFLPVKKDTSLPDHIVLATVTEEG